MILCNTFVRAARQGLIIKGWDKVRILATQPIISSSYLNKSFVKPL